MCLQNLWSHPWSIVRETEEAAAFMVGYRIAVKPLPCHKWLRPVFLLLLLGCLQHPLVRAPLRVLEVQWRDKWTHHCLLLPLPPLLLLGCRSETPADTTATAAAACCSAGCRRRACCCRCCCCAACCCDELGGGAVGWCGGASHVLLGHEKQH